MESVPELELVRAGSLWVDSYLSDPLLRAFCLNRAEFPLHV